MVDSTVAEEGMKLGDGRFDVAKRGMKLRMVDLTVAQRGTKLGDGRFDCCTVRY